MATGLNSDSSIVNVGSATIDTTSVLSVAQALCPPRNLAFNANISPAIRAAGENYERLTTGFIVPTKESLPALEYPVNVINWQDSQRILFPTVAPIGTPILGPGLVSWDGLWWDVGEILRDVQDFNIGPQALAENEAEHLHDSGWLLSPEKMNLVIS